MLVKPDASPRGAARVRTVQEVEPVIGRFATFLLSMRLSVADVPAPAAWVEVRMDPALALGIQALITTLCHAPRGFASGIATLTTVFAEVVPQSSS